VIKSIYPDCVSNDPSNGVIKIEVPVQLPQPWVVTSLPQNNTSPDNIDDSNANEASGSAPNAVSISALPPLLLDLLLPPSYPLYSPPQIISLYATHAWLPLTASLQSKLLDMWQAGEGVLFDWIDWLHGGDFLQALSLVSTQHGMNALRLPSSELKILLPKLVAYDKDVQEMRFSLHSYNCEICLTSISGARCILLSCEHVFCRSCLEDFWKLCITEGEVSRVGCPDPQCVKEGKEASEDEVRRVVTEEEVRRWKWLRQKKAFEKDPTMVYCPLPFCQNPVPLIDNVEEGSGWERLRTCPECGFSFCACCKRTWHGAITDCPLNVTDEFVEGYMNLPAGSPDKLVLERRFGKAQLAKLVARHVEDQANRKWLQESTMACPNCNVHVEKTMGCNHMTCGKCGTHFCYRCGQKLKGSNPYQHFSTPGQSCYYKLFDTVSQADHEWQFVDM